MSQTIKNVALLGASGNLGPTILEGLDKSGKFNITVFSRKESNATFPSHIKVIKTDYSESELVEQFKGQDAVISTLFGMVDQRPIIDAAVKAGVKRFMPSEWGSDSTNPKGQEICPVFKPKADIVEYLKSKANENPNFTWSAVATGPFLDWCLKVGFFGFDLQAKKMTIWDGGSPRFSSTTLPTIGKAAAQILLKFEETKNRYVWIQSALVSQNDLKAALERATNAQWEVEQVKSEDMIKKGYELLPQGFPGIALLILGTIFNANADTGSNFTTHTKLDNDLLGLPKEDVQSVVDSVVKG
ncbi:MAG: hypothetical protein M1823_000840 [Watsoniomyces obsoletus]|nr:MAG: hypothetical protein M1823_000840 [Watsoniomyces obsoletus]